MKKRLSKKTISLSALMFVLNVILLFAMIFLLLEVNEGLNVINYITENYNRVLFVASAVIILSMLMYAYYYFECTEILRDMSKIIECFVLLDIALLLSFIIGQVFDTNARPFAFLALMAATLLGRREAVFLNIIYSLILFIIDINFTAGSMWVNCACLLVTFCAGMTAVFITPAIKTRIQSILMVFVLLVPAELIIGVMEVLFAEQMGENIIALAYGALGCFFSVLGYMIILPIFEVMFSELTVFRLRELTSDDAKLIKKLKEEAPGTYNHSVVVAQLAQACATAIGEDGELARAAAYYHDMGKLKNPEMFTENQSDYNMHNELSPELSADIIRSHTRDGAQLIRKNHLPEFFADCAIQHHGTMPIKYFYAKALKMSDGEINIANYSYSGPTPRSKIAAILMIVDASEAASRSLKDRSPKAVEELVTSLIEERLDMDQFADCDITMRELTIISHTVAVALSGVYHNRISYPKLKISKRDNQEA
ncbi:MAG TPA: HDIG domain-containing protein [Candidatus Coproplasma excrementipullorum]|nr:HDIG domain-containing protein [Candidatus Coproplasma excrementipullorum]